MRALDLYCAGGGAARGLMDAGFDVVGWDVRAEPRYYPGVVHEGSVLDLDPEYVASFDFAWASPPCQAFSKATKRHDGRPETHENLIPATRALLDAAGVPYVMENVPDAPLRPDVLLCGLMVDLPLLRRHRIFECSGFSPRQPDHPVHRRGERYVSVTGHTGGSSTRDGTRGFGTVADWRKAMGIDWLPARLLAQAIPPAYSRYLAKEFLRTVS